MSTKFWKTKAPRTPHPPTTWPSIIQVLLQLGAACFIIVVWTGLFAGYVNLNQGPAINPTTSEFVAASAPQTATHTPSPLPSHTPVMVDAVPTQTSTSTSVQKTVTVEATATALATEVTAITPAVIDATNTPNATQTQVPATVEPSPTVTSAPLPTNTPAATNTPIPPTAPPSTTGDLAEVSFATNVFPIFEQRCIKCHGGEKPDGSGLRIEEGLDLRTYDDILAGSLNGPVIEPGNVENSFLIEQIVKGEMPKKAPSLLPAEIRAITAWVEAGAPNN